MHSDIEIKLAFDQYCTKVLGIHDKERKRAEFEAFTAISTDPYIDTINLLLHEEPNWRGYFEWITLQAQQSETKR